MSSAAAILTSSERAPAGTATAERPLVPWFVTCAVLAITSSVVGGHWDVSWHRSIGRDTFWSAPHLAIYLCGVLAGISSGYTILSTTFLPTAETRAASVRIFGLRGPLGSFVTAWGGIAMLTAAPFDDWWHSAYGLDVAILSPPHAVLMAGNAAIIAGTLILVLAEMNRSTGKRRACHEALFLYVGGVLVTLLLFGALELVDVIFMHGYAFYRVVALLVPVLLAGMARATGNRRAALITASVYTTILLAFEWILPRFPAEPRLGPVLYPVTHFVPPGFPLLIVAPAAAMDLVLRRSLARRWLALLAGLAFVATFFAVQWPFASFLMTPAARNWFFGADLFDYFTGPDSYAATHQFYLPEETSADLAIGVATTLGAAVLSTWVGLACGDGMRRIRR
jgi:hypothetical protein